jgi:hypothetical protein
VASSLVFIRFRILESVMFQFHVSVENVFGMVSLWTLVANEVFVGVMATLVIFQRVPSLASVFTFITSMCKNVFVIVKDVSLWTKQVVTYLEGEERRE